MDETTTIIRDYYDADPEAEWSRTVDRPEFLLTRRMLARYIQPGDRVLDIGGGPGRYALHLAAMGCDVTLLDLSPGNIAFAKERAAEQNLTIRALSGDARAADRLVSGPFDHVLLMGPLYHLLEEADRARAVNAALAPLRPGGTFFASFISLFGGMIYAMKEVPEILLSTLPAEVQYKNCVLAQKTFAGEAFTRAVFIDPREITPFMARFPLEKLHLFGQESIIAPCERNLMAQPPEVVAAWLDLAEQLWEREELLSWSDHLMYVGRRL